MQNVKEKHQGATFHQSREGKCHFMGVIILYLSPWFTLLKEVINCVLGKINYVKWPTSSYVAYVIMISEQTEHDLDYF